MGTQNFLSVLILFIVVVVAVFAADWLKVKVGTTT